MPSARQKPGSSRWASGSPSSTKPQAIASDRLRKDITKAKDQSRRIARLANALRKPPENSHRALSMSQQRNAIVRREPAATKQAVTLKPRNSGTENLAAFSSRLRLEMCHFSFLQPGLNNRLSIAQRKKIPLPPIVQCTARKKNERSHCARVGRAIRNANNPAAR